MQDDKSVIDSRLLTQMHHVFHFKNGTLKGQQLDLKSLFQMSIKDYRGYTRQLMHDLVTWSAQVRTSDLSDCAPSGGLGGRGGGGVGGNHNEQHYKFGSLSLHAKRGHNVIPQPISDTLIMLECNQK